MSESLYSIEDLAKRLREMAELTANASKNWDNYEGICLDMLKAVRDRDINRKKDA